MFLLPRGNYCEHLGVNFSPIFKIMFISRVFFPLFKSLSSLFLLEINIYIITLPSKTLFFAF